MVLSVERYVEGKDVFVINASKEDEVLTGDIKKHLYMKHSL